MWVNQFKPDDLVSKDNFPALYVYTYMDSMCNLLHLATGQSNSLLCVAVVFRGYTLQETLLDLRDPSEDCFMYLELMQNTDELLDSQSIKEK